MIYQANKIGKKIEEMKEFVLGKISLTLPQDILINIRINGFRQKYPQYFEKIISFYEKGEHSNFIQFLEKMNSYKNVVYTFSNNLDNIKDLNNINNNLIGEINENNIKYININSIKSEKQLEKIIEEFLNEDNHKICIIKILPYESYLMEYLQYFIENKEKEYSNKSNGKKAFIFIVYMNRVLNDDLTNIKKLPLKDQNLIKKKLLEKSLTHLSEYYQIFIDNLNGFKW